MRSLTQEGRQQALLLFIQVVPHDGCLIGPVWMAEAPKDVVGLRLVVKSKGTCASRSPGGRSQNQNTYQHKAGAAEVLHRSTVNPSVAVATRSIYIEKEKNDSAKPGH